MCVSVAAFFFFFFMITKLLYLERENWIEVLPLISKLGMNGLT